MLGFVKDSPQSHRYQDLAARIAESMAFMRACGVEPQTVPALSETDFYTSHEGLHLNYEQARTRKVPRRTGWYNLNTHLPWIGDRTRAAGGAHVEYFRGIQNPIGVKIGPSTACPRTRV